ncbi:hypothetical protein [Nocardia niwae]|uniref:hypothetical protein n=1 Tax=Nocardia niwae TaxID=626084 RepID=UPI0007A556B1|nr:hypothetical protein [Nocardia niwae]
MDSSEIERIADDVVRVILTEEIEFSDIYVRDDTADASEDELRAIHKHASSTMRKLAAQFQGKSGDAE